MLVGVSTCTRDESAGAHTLSVLQRIKAACGLADAKEMLQYTLLESTLPVHTCLSQAVETILVCTHLYWFIGKVFSKCLNP